MGVFSRWGNQTDLLSDSFLFQRLDTSKYHGLSGQRNAIEIAVRRGVDVGIVGEILAGDELCAVKRLGAGHDTGFGHWLDASLRKLRQAFPGTNRNRQASSRSSLRRCLDWNNKEFPVGRPYWTAVACAYPARESAFERNCQIGRAHV